MTNRVLFKLLLGVGLGMTLNELLYPTIGTKAMYVCAICAAILQPDYNVNLMNTIFGKESERKLNNTWILVAYLLIYLIVLIVPFILEVYENNKDYYYIWTGISSLIYFLSVSCLFIRFLSRRNKLRNS